MNKLIIYILALVSSVLLVLALVYALEGINVNEWQRNVYYNIGDQVTYNGDEYICVQEHLSTNQIKPKHSYEYWYMNIQENHKQKLKKDLEGLYNSSVLKDYNVISVDKSIKIITYDVVLQNKNSGEIKNITWYKTK